MKTAFWSITIFLVASACAVQDEQISNSDALVIPDSIAQLENLTVISPHVSPVDTVELIQETIFESNEEVLIAGYISDVEIDNSDNVFIGVTPYNSNSPTGIYAFNPDGSFSSAVGRSGQGPGEYTTVSTLALGNDRLYVFDTRLMKVVSYFLDDYSLDKERLVRKDLLPVEETLARRSDGQSIQMYVSDLGQITMKFRALAISLETDIDKIHFFNISDDGMLQPERLLELDRYRFTFPESNSPFILPVVYPFERSSLVDTNSNGDFYSIWSEDFLIRIFNASGEYQRAIYMPVEQSQLLIDDVDLNTRESGMLENAIIPTNWPAVHAMELDEERRLWVATITDSDSTFTWHVISPSGELLARFQLPGERDHRDVMTSPWVIKVRNNYLYTREQDIIAGIDRIIKHRIEFKKN